MSINPVAISSFNNMQNNITPNNTQAKETVQKKEIIDKISDAVVNPRDVKDCVAVPRGIFKAYMLIMGGSGLLAIANYLPTKMSKVKKGLSILGTVMNIASAWFFAKPFAVKSLSPTVEKNSTNK